MNNLTHNDFQTILKAVEILNSDIDPKSLPKRLLNSVNHAVSRDITAFEMVSPKGEYQGCLIYEPLDAVTPQELEVYNEYINEHPFHNAILIDRRFDAIKVADFLPDEKFVRTGIYNEYYRRISIHRQIAVTMSINANCLMFCTLSRGGKDFDETERAILNLLSPHFTTAVQNTNSFEQLQIEQENWQAVAEAMGRTIIDLDSQGSVKRLTERAAKLLEKYFSGEKLKIQGLPASLYRWIAGNIEESRKNTEYRLPPKSLTFTVGSETLTIQFSYRTASNLASLLLFEEKELTPQDLISLGLTKRESEVLYWIACGKSNPEIAILCDISVRTVHKHVEHIYIKLGIETRMAAVLRAKEAIH